MSFSEPTLTLEVSRRPDHAVLRLQGCNTLNEHNCSELSHHLSLLPDGITSDRLVLDLDGIHYVTSTAFGALVGFNRRVRAAGGQLALGGVGPFVREALAITRLDQLLEVLTEDGDSPRRDRLIA